MKIKMPSNLGAEMSGNDAHATNSPAPVMINKISKKLTPTRLIVEYTTKNAVT